MSNWIRGVVVAKHCWKEGMYSIKVDAPVMVFQAGQHTWIAPDCEGERVARPFSLVNAPDQRPLEIYFNAKGATAARLSRVQAGDTLWVSQQASGALTLGSVPANKTLWLLATGTGLGGFLSILRCEATWRQFRRVILAHGVRYRGDRAYASEISALARERGGRFCFVPVISREELRGALHGRITELIVSGELERFAGGRIDPESSHVMMCGNPGMIEEGKRILEKRGLKRHYSDAPGQYSVEDYQ